MPVVRRLMLVVLLLSVAVCPLTAQISRPPPMTQQPAVGRAVTVPGATLYNPYAPYPAPASQVRPEEQIPAGAPIPAPLATLPPPSYSQAWAVAPVPAADQFPPSGPGQAAVVAVPIPARPVHLDRRSGPPYPPGFDVPPAALMAVPLPAPDAQPPAYPVAAPPAMIVTPPTLYPPAVPPSAPLGGPVAVTPTWPTLVTPAPGVAPMPGTPWLTPPVFPGDAPYPRGPRQEVPAGSTPGAAPAPGLPPLPGASALDVPPPTPGVQASSVGPQGAAMVPPTMLPAPVRPAPRRREMVNVPPPEIQKGPVTEPWQAEELRHLMQALAAIRALPEKGANPTALSKFMTAGRRASRLMGFEGWPVLPRFQPRTDENVVRNRSHGAWEYRYYGCFQTRLNGWVKPAGQFVQFDLDFNGRSIFTNRYLGAISSDGALRGRIEMLGVRRDGRFIRLVIDLDGVLTRDDGYPCGGRMTISGTDIVGRPLTFPLAFPIDIRRLPQPADYERRISNWPAMGKKK